MLTFLTVASLHSQSDSIRTLLSRGLNHANFFAEDSYYARGAQPRALEGSVYLDDRWTDSRVLTPENRVIGVKARYRLLDEEMQVQQGGEVLVPYPGRIRAIALGDRVFIPLPYRDELGVDRLSFYQLLVEGEMDLLLHRSLEVRASDYNPALQVGSRNDRLVQRVTYYYRRKGGEPRPLKTTKAGVLHALSRRRKAVAAFAKEAQLSPRKEADLVRLFEFYNRQ